MNSTRNSKCARPLFTVSDEIQSQIRAEQRKIGVHIKDIKTNDEKDELAHIDEIVSDLEIYRQGKIIRKKRGCSWSSTELD